MPIQTVDGVIQTADGVIQTVEVAPDGGTVEEAVVAVTASFFEDGDRSSSPTQYRYHRVGEGGVSACPSAVPLGEDRLSVEEAESKGFERCRNCFDMASRCPLCDAALGGGLPDHLPECPERERSFPAASTDGGERRR